jgi:hypothetical protein
MVKLVAELTLFGQIVTWQLEWMGIDISRIGFG